MFIISAFIIFLSRCCDRVQRTSVTIESLNWQMILSFLSGNKLQQTCSVPLKCLINAWYNKYNCSYPCRNIQNSKALKFVTNQLPKDNQKLDFYVTREYSVMANADSYGLSLNDVIAKLDNFAPKSLAESWDNVGLLVEPVTKKNVRKILLTNDLTEDVMEEAVNLCTDLIISYHPPIFAPLKSITGRTWKVRFKPV